LETCQGDTVVITIETLYRNYYKCNKCKRAWTDVWDSMCNDRCPGCNHEIEPFKSYELVECEVEPEIEDGL
jgi:hypothetical protein